eukprot:3626097-Lingulodinium_polyedra.AAC.1
MNAFSACVSVAHAQCVRGAYAARVPLKRRRNVSHVKCAVDTPRAHRTRAPNENVVRMFTK